MNKLFRIISIVIIAMLMTAMLAPAARPVASASNSDGLSIVTLQPDALEYLRAQGLLSGIGLLNRANQGIKFNPEGETVGPLPPVDTQQKVIVLFAEFTTLPPGGPAERLDLSYFDDMLFGTAYDPVEYVGIEGHPTDRTLYNYYKEVSYGAIDVVTLNMPTDTGWINVGHPYEYYCLADGTHDNSFGPFPENAQGLVRDAVLAADAMIDFSQYAVEGVVPNLFVVYAGTGAEWSADPSLIWSHSWDVSEGTGLDGIMVDGVKINNYAMMPEVGGDLTGFLGVVTGPYPPTVGVYAHEYGHVLGLPDQYDYGYESDGTDVYSLMAGGSWNRYPSTRIFSGNSPSHLDAWSKYMLGWVEPIVIDEAADALTLSLADVEFNPVVYKMIVPDSDGKEYYLFENRQGIGFDQGLIRFGTHGLAIYHVDETVFFRNYWRPNEAENWTENRWTNFKRVWTGERHYAISVIQADDAWDLERAVYENPTGDFSPTLAGDLYPGYWGITEFGSFTAPNSSTYYFWGGNDDPKFGYSGVTVTGIQEVDGLIIATFDFIPWIMPNN
jgi:immune inhibitor A